MKEKVLVPEGGLDFIKSIRQDLTGLVNKLVNSEWSLIHLMVVEKIWKGDAPDIPSAYADGSIDAGPFLFLIQHPYLISSGLIRDAVDAFSDTLNLFGVTLPASNLSAENYGQLSIQPALIYEDGTVMGTNVYEQYDQNWLSAVLNLVKTIATGNWAYGKSLRIPSDHKISLTSKTGINAITIGLVGDWGAGTDTSKQVMTALTNSMTNPPDYIIHLGDVYYAGTPHPDFIPKYILPNQEIDNLMNCWPAGFENRSFTLNSNHEMYSGAQGLVNNALNGHHTPFAAQNGCTMFALAAGDWTVLALDSAYHADKSGLFMFGSISSNDDSGQIEWIKTLNLNPSKVIVLTHHNGFEYNCQPVNHQKNQDREKYQEFWNSVIQALGGEPYAWYWGHIHDGIVYNSPITIKPAPLVPPAPAFHTNTFCRCVGHGALPFGLPYGLKNADGKTISQVSYFANTVNAGSTEVYNGYSTLTFELDPNGICTRIIELFFDISNKNPQFKNQLYPLTESIHS